MKHLWVCGLLILLSCTEQNPADEELSAPAEPQATILSETEIERLSNEGMQYTLDDNQILASSEGIQGSLDELSRKSNQFEADVERMEEVSGVTSSINLSQEALQQLAEVQENLNMIQQKLDEVRKAKADRQHQQAAELLRQANSQMRYAEALYTMALADENILTSE